MQDNPKPISAQVRKQQIDPALLTFDEYYKIANETGKFHDSNAYDMSLDRINQYNKIKDYKKLLRNVRIRGISFQIRAHEIKRQYLKRDVNGNPLGIDGQTRYYTDEEIQMLGLQPFDINIGVFEMEQKQCVAILQDEWGCVLVAVAQEYRGLGIGPILVELQRRQDPGKTSGGFTPAGYRNFQKVYAHFVRDAMAKGLYRKLLTTGDITLERVKEITASIKTDRDKPKTDNVGTSDPKDWLLYVGEYGDFILYDRKVKELIEDGWDKNQFWIEKMILGMVYVSGERDIRLMQFGGTTGQIRIFLMNCALSYCAKEGQTLYIEGNEHNYVMSAYGTMGAMGNTPGFKSQEVTPTGKELDYKPLGLVERRFRKSFDRYDEFKNNILELAYGKFRGLSESRIMRKR